MVTEAEGLLLLLAAGVGGAIVGYHAGLKRASAAIWEACQATAQDTTAMNQAALPVRERIIAECIKAVEKIRPEVTADLKDKQRDAAIWMRSGVEDALEALHKLIDMRSSLFNAPFRERGESKYRWQRTKLEEDEF